MAIIAQTVADSTLPLETSFLQYGVFVILSSIHEVLLMIADKNKVDVGYIRQMIKEVNYENVSEVERLSDSPYYYDVATDTLRIAE